MNKPSTFGPLRKPLHMADPTDLFRLFHSLLRWFIFLSVGIAGIMALVRYVRQLPIVVWERTLTIVAMVLCHIQLVVGFVFYGLRWRMLHKWQGNMPNSDVFRFVKFEHPTMMVIVIALVTIGRLTSKKATTESGKQLRIAIFFLLALALMLYAIPWPGTHMGQGRGWI
jgi:predicted membrane channel-forming protein YqfA (hemolysin III family)